MNKVILLIEDNEGIRDNMKEILELSHYKVIVAVNGKEGVEQAILHKPHLIVCDIMMPLLDGYGVIHMLQKNTETQNIPFIFLTAKAEKSEVRKGMELGADDYIMKPFNGTDLLNAIESRLTKSARINEQIVAGIEGLNYLVMVTDNKDPLQEIAVDRNINKIKKKHAIYSEGGYPRNMYFVEQGKVKTFRSNDDGKELVTGLYNKGDFFGYISLLDGAVYKESAQALEDTEVSVIPREDFERLINNNRSVMIQFIKLLANNVSMREEQLLSLAYNSLRKKVANALITIHNKYGNGVVDFAIDISRENLANVAGAAKESVIRTLGDFKDEKLIEMRRGSVVIVDENKLRHLIN